MIGVVMTNSTMSEIGPFMDHKKPAKWYRNFSKRGLGVVLFTISGFSFVLGYCIELI